MTTLTILFQAAIATMLIVLPALVISHNAKRGRNKAVRETKARRKVAKRQRRINKMTDTQLAIAILKGKV